ncbi:hypothetical protein M422DRAFT_75681 [Sphaerobolus stellatus SS14]|uniref:Amidohydrolase-related domain-containing protein n=1 Tax=Sphaerobolus stellatus (strain SS14) TaxID=990650 RepID=A0A0C9UCS0_SPHS4|nr:hypothetical protein M422DRAFT_75681 [Sphaerobolus stellatus SS14]
MGRESLPLGNDNADHRKLRRKSGKLARLGLFSVVLCSISLVLYVQSLSSINTAHSRVPYKADEILARCAELNRKPGPPRDFHTRTHSDRFVPGTNPVLLHNATIWTGSVDDHGKEEIVIGDVLMDRGIVRWVGGANDLKNAKEIYGENLAIVDVGGAWVTPGLVDMHSHIGVESSPGLAGAEDSDSIKGLTLPWLRSLDGLNTHDESYHLTIAGGVTTSNVLPGSADAIGGQAYVIKLRSTSERSASSMLVERPGSVNSTGWRQIKHAVGENPSRLYQGTRMDTIWALRDAYKHGQELVRKQDEYCSAATKGIWDGLGSFPEDLQWEALADVIRGKVKVHTHCHEAVDFDGVVRLSSEFKFPIAAFHHAAEAYLVPDLIKKAWGSTPAVAIFATFARYKREAWRSSEFAARILADNGLKVVMKSDHPQPINARSLLFEAQQAYFYGLPAHLALASITTTPVEILGLGHRLGYLKEGHDADLVIWDSHPLALGATPKQVYIDGIPQIQDPHTQEKVSAFQELPKVPNFDEEAKKAVEYEGLPPLLPRSAKTVVFTNVRDIWFRGEHGMTCLLDLFKGEEYTNREVVVQNGQITCMGPCHYARSNLQYGYEEIDLEGGFLAPGLISFGSPLGLGDILLEDTTNNGNAFDALGGPIPPSIAGGEGYVDRAVDGLQFATRNALLAYRAGVTAAIAQPDSTGLISGVGVMFATGARHRLEKGAIFQDATSFHVTIQHEESSSAPSISTKIGTLRRLLMGGGTGEIKHYFDLITKGEIPLVITVESADIIATLIQLKKDVESIHEHSIQMTLVRATEAHLLARELGEAGVGVILSPVRPHPLSWEQRRILPGLPLSKESSLSTLLAHGVTVGIGSQPMGAWTVRNTPFELAWAALQSNLSKEQALALVTTNLEKLLGVNHWNGSHLDIVAYRGGDLLEFGSKVVGVISHTRELVDLF